MPAFLETIFGRKKPTAAAASDELAKVEAALAAAPGRIARGKAVLARVADLTDAEHEAAIAELAAAERSVVRLEAQAVALRQARAEAQFAEAAAALRKRAEEAKKASEGMPKLLDRLEQAYLPVVAIAEEISAKMAAVSSANGAIAAAKKAGLEAPDLVDPHYAPLWWEPGTTDPDREVVEEVWRHPDGRGVSVFGERDGKMVPLEYGAKKHTVTRTIPGKKRPGRSMVAPIFDLHLPATRLGGKQHWPR